MQECRKIVFSFFWYSNFSDMLERLKTLRRRRRISDLDLHFSRFMAQLAGSDVPELLLGACVASRWTGNGNVCVNLHSLAGQPLLDPEGPLAPEAHAWIEGLRNTPVVGYPGEFQPLILDAKGRLYLYRYWAYEKQLADDLKRRASLEPEGVDEGRLREDLERLFPRADESVGTNWRKVAAATAVLKGLCVISGGPGTGKTTTVVRILALLAGQGAHRPRRMGLAAPTGKAAARMQEAIRLAKGQLPLDRQLLRAIPEDASTIHRLLGPRSNSVYFRHRRDNPLPLDVLVVDEASMVDLALMAKLVDALPPRARLILLGDKDQLASVEAGAVLGDVCGDVPGFSEAFSKRLRRITDEESLVAQSTDTPLGDSIVLLRHSYRFGPDSGIGNLARAVNGGHEQEALAAMESHRFEDIAWSPADSVAGLYTGMAGQIDAGFRPYLEAVQAGVAYADIFAAFNRFRVLCAVRNGPASVEALNREIEKILHSRDLIDSRRTWYPGRPIMITRNDYNLRLFNGDVGIVLHDPEASGELRVFFETSDAGPRRFLPTRLPHHETVYAMTVHKSQGSEFDHVLLALPFEFSQVLTRELIYTGITRARKRVEIWGKPQVFQAAVGNRIRRSSGLRDALWGRDE